MSGRESRDHERTGGVRLWTVGRVAKEHGCAQITVREAIVDGLLSGYVVDTGYGSGSTYVIPEAAAREWEPRKPGRPRKGRLPLRPNRMLGSRRAEA